MRETRLRLPEIGITWRTLGIIAAIAVVLGLAVALVSDSAGLRRSEIAYTPHAIPTRAPSTPRPTATPTVRIAAAGKLGAAPALVASSRTAISVAAPPAYFSSRDGGATWTPLSEPAGATRLAVDPGNPQHLLAGGGDVRTSTDGGRTWTSPKTAPPAGGPFQPLALNPGDPAVWFLVAGNRLLRTRDAGVSWRNTFPSLPDLVNPVLVPAGSPDRFLLASGAHVYELQDNGQQVVDRGSLPGGAAVVAVAPADNGSILARSRDGAVYLGRGTTWTDTSAPLGGPIAAAPGHLYVGDGRAALGRAGDVVVSVDGGATWQHSTGLPGDQSVEALAATVDGNAYAYSYGGDVYASVDGGKTWRQVSTAFRATPPTPSSSPSPR